MILQDRSIVVTGGTGSLGEALVRRQLSGELGAPKKVVGLSRADVSAALRGAQPGEKEHEILIADEEARPLLGENRRMVEQGPSAEGGELVRGRIRSRMEEVSL